MKRNTITAAALALALALVAACAHQPPIVKHEVVEVPVEVRVPPDPALVADTIVDPSPVPACMHDGKPAYCNGQVAAMLEDALLAVGLCNADKRALRASGSSR